MQGAGLMGKLLKLRGSELTAREWPLDMLARLCREDPLSAHCYAFYYLTREPSRTEIVLKASGDTIESYSLIRYGGRFTIMDIYEIHIWNPIGEVVVEIGIPPSKRADIQLHNSTPSDVELVVGHFRSLGFSEFQVGEFHDMICTHESFKPSSLERLAVKLGEEHAPLYRDLELERGVEVSVEEAREILKAYPHYGVVVGNTLASIAASYITLPWVYVVGGVFTRERYRGRGYAKAVVSAITREALSSGAIAGLHVEAGNEPAIRVYETLGYKATKTRTWILAYP
mgnify:CR=1 FL=1